jgi:serine/threonine-protein kinase
MVIESDPPGAAIRIDGEVRAEHTPATIRELPLAHYTVTVVSEGYDSFTQEVDLTEAAQQSTIHAALVHTSASSFGVASVTTTPAGAHLLLDGRALSAEGGGSLVTPATVPEIEPGVDHTLVISLDGYVPVTRTLNLTRGQVETITLTLERTPLGPNESLLVLTTDPPDSRVQLDAQWYETGSPFEIRVPTRDYRLRVTHTGRRMDEREIELVGGQRTELSITLERERTATPPHTGSSESHPTASGPGMITIAATPWCNVTIDGRAVGETPVVNHSLPSGSHTVVCTNPDTHASRTVRVDVRPGETTRTRITL